MKGRSLKLEGKGIEVNVNNPAINLRAALNKTLSGPSKKSPSLSSPQGDSYVVVLSGTAPDGSAVNVPMAVRIPKGTKLDGLDAWTKSDYDER